jgi:hypothetical protein
MKILHILVLMFCFVVMANAQKAILTGSVYDPNGSLIVNSKITAVNQKGEKFVALTNEEGVYVLSLPYNNEYNLSLFPKVSKYDITVEAGLPGFEKYTLKDFKFISSSKEQMNLDFALDVQIIIDRYPVPSKKKKKKTSTKMFVKLR